MKKITVCAIALLLALSACSREVYVDKQTRIIRESDKSSDVQIVDRDRTVVDRDRTVVDRDRTVIDRERSSTETDREVIRDRPRRSGGYKTIIND